LLFTELKNSK